MLIVRSIDVRKVPHCYGPQQGLKGNVILKLKIRGEGFFVNKYVLRKAP